MNSSLGGGWPPLSMRIGSPFTAVGQLWFIYGKISSATARSELAPMVKSIMGSKYLPLAKDTSTILLVPARESW